MRHVLRPDVRRKATDVRDGLPKPGAFFGTREQITALRPQSAPTNRFRFGEQTITTRVNVMVPRVTAPAPLLDVTSAMDDVATKPHRPAARVVEPMLDPFAEVEV